MDPVTIGLLLSAIIGAGTTLYAGAKQRGAMKEAQEEARQLGAQEREDVLYQNSISNALARRQQMLNEKQFRFQKQESQLARQERKEERAYGRASDLYGRLANLMNTNVGLAQSVSSAIGARRR